MQNTKKWLIIMVAVAFGVTLVASLVMLFSVKKVSAEFSDFGDSEAVNIQRDLDAFKGKSLIFLGTAEVYRVGEKYPHYEITAVEKEFPNVLKITVEKRAEVFKVVTKDKSYVLDESGVIINDTGETENAFGVVPIIMGDISVQNAAVGKKIATSDDELFYAVIKTARELNLNDVVKEIKIVINTKWVRDAILTTYTGVEVEVRNVEEDGSAKIAAAFAKYEELGDYEKSSHKILADKREDGEIFATWTSY